MEFGALDFGFHGVMNFNKIKQLVKTVGGRCLIIDNDDAFVVMGIDEYKKINLLKNYRDEKIADLTESELLDKINQDIEVWQNSQVDKNVDAIEPELPYEDVKIEKVLF